MRLHKTPALRAVFALSAVGNVVGWILIVANEIRPITRMLPVYVISTWGVVAFFLAFLNYPRWLGETKLPMSAKAIARAAPKWSNALVVVTTAVASFLMQTTWNVPRQASSASELVGHPELFRRAVAIFMMPMALSLQLSLSGMAREAQAIKDLQKP